MKKRIIGIAFSVVILISLTSFLKSYFLFPVDSLYTEAKETSKYVVLVGCFVVGTLLKTAYKKTLFAGVVVFSLFYALSFMHYEYVTEEKLVQNTFFAGEQILKIKEVEEIKEIKRDKRTLFIGDKKEIKMKVSGKVLRKIEKKSKE